MSGGLFIGIPVDLDRAVACLDSAKQLWSSHDHIGWLEPESLHCTLAYVEIKGDRFYYIANAMHETMGQVSSGCAHFSTTLNRFEWFGLSNMLVLTNSQDNASPKLTQLARILARRLRGRGLRVMQGQPFRAHVSLGERDTKAVSVLSSIYNPSPTQQLDLRLTVTSLNLYQAIAHHRYKILHTVELIAPRQQS